MTALFTSRPAAEAAAERLRIYAQPQRLMILSYLERGEHTVGEIEEATGITQPALSQQLAELRRAELVTARREAKKVYYQLASDWVRRCVLGIEAMTGGGVAAGEEPMRHLIESAQPNSPQPKRPSGAAAFAIID